MRWLLVIGAVFVALLAVLVVRELRDDGDDADARSAEPERTAKEHAEAATGGARGGDPTGAPWRGSRRPAPPLPTRPGAPAADSPSAAGSGYTPRPTLSAGDSADAGPVFEPGMPLDDRAEKVREIWFARDYETALAGAEEVLAESPNEHRSLWVAVAAACMLGNSEKAQAYFDRVRRRDNPERERLAQRCHDAGIELKQ